jgi:hypothetical protein
MAEQLLEDIERFKRVGPYTFHKVFELAKKTHLINDSNFLLHMALDSASHKFAPTEFKLLIDPQSHLSEEDREIWSRGTKTWRLPCIEQFTEDQILVLCELLNLVNDAIEHVNWKTMPKQTLYDILKILRKATHTTH